MCIDVLNSGIQVSLLSVPLCLQSKQETHFCVIKLNWKKKGHLLPSLGFESKMQAIER